MLCRPAATFALVGTIIGPESFTTVLAREIKLTFMRLV